MLTFSSTEVVHNTMYPKHFTNQPGPGRGYGRGRGRKGRNWGRRAADYEEAGWRQGPPPWARRYEAAPEEIAGAEAPFGPPPWRGNWREAPADYESWRAFRQERLQARKTWLQEALAQTEAELEQLNTAE